MKNSGQKFFALIFFAFFTFSCNKETENPIKSVRLHNFKIEKNVMNNNSIKTIAIDKSGNKWFATDGGGLSKFDGNAWTHYSKNEGLMSNNIHTLIIDSQDNKWIGYGFSVGGVSKFDGISFSNYVNPNGPGNGTVLCIKQDSKGIYYFGTYGGVSMYDKSNWLLYYYYPEGGPTVESIAFDKGGNTWLGLSKRAGLDGGLTMFDGSNATKYSINDGLISNYVLCIAIDSKNNKWVGTNGFGVSKFDGPNWVTYNEKDGLINNTVNTIVIDSDDNIWFGTSGGVSMFDGKTWINYNKSNGLINNLVYSIAIDNEDHKWIGTSDGITELYYE